MQIQVGNARPAQRVNRRPNFPCAGTMKPYGLYPLWAAPVLPGETIQSMSTKLRTLSLPTNHPLTGAWQESWLIYVKFTDLDRELGQSFISDEVSPTAWNAAADADRYFTKAGQVDWIRKCVERFHDAYFVDEGETPRSIDGVRQVKLNNRSWYQNMIFKPADVALPTTDASDMYQAMDEWMMLQQMKMTELTYEKYLETYGVTSVRQNIGEPEILRFARSWTQPVNTVNPENGTPSSAWVWSDEVKLEKAKRFDEPGFVVMVSTVRPKMYQANLGGSIIGNLWGFSDWYPSYNLSDPTAGVKQLLADDPALGGTGTTEELIYDHRDILSHGEQFINTDTHPFPLPMASGMSQASGSENPDIRGEYATAADIDALFPGTFKGLYYEGMGSMVIAGHVKDTTL